MNACERATTTYVRATRTRPRSSRRNCNLANTCRDNASVLLPTAEGSIFHSMDVAVRGTPREDTPRRVVSAVIIATVRRSSRVIRTATTGGCTPKAGSTRTTTPRSGTKDTAVVAAKTANKNERRRDVA